MNTTAPETSRQRPAQHRLLVLLAAFALFGAACTSTTTVTETAESTNDATATFSEIDSDLEQGIEPADEDDEPEAGTTDAPTDGSDDGEPADAPPAEDAPADDDSEPESGTEDAPSEPLGAGEASVTLLDAGAEPRTELRISPAATCSELMSITTTQEIQQTIGGQQMPNAGAITNVIEMETSVVPNGDNFDVRSAIVSAGAGPGTPPAVAAALNAELEGIIGITSFVTMTDRGFQVPGSSRVEGAEVLGDFASTVENLNQTQAPLPLEAVGVGARWQTISVIELEGLLVSNITENELVSIDGTILEIRSTGFQEVDPTTRMSVQGLTGEVIVWDVISSGTTVMDLATISPLTSLGTSEGTQEFDFGAGGELSQTLFTEIAVEAVPNDGCTGRTIRG